MRVSGMGQWSLTDCKWRHGSVLIQQAPCFSGPVTEDLDRRTPAPAGLP